MFTSRDLINKEVQLQLPVDYNWNEWKQAEIAVMYRATETPASIRDRRLFETLRLSEH